MTYRVGQRWFNTSDSELGVGTVLEIDGRLVTLNFPAIEENRTYAANNAPLARLEFRRGDTVHDKQDGDLDIIEVSDVDGIFHYLTRNADGCETVVSETLLDVSVRTQHPEQRLLSGQGDSAHAFALRVATLEHSDRIKKSSLYGLSGPRVELIPHQLYIANEIGCRYAPRVLLADEVGLGKTIEAGMIIHQQLISGRSNRVLLVVPEPLLHQWLVEMLRRFNLHFSLFDNERYEEYSAEENPFETEQLVLCGLSWLTGSPGVQERLLAADWDTLVVDEAHHLHWSENESSPEYDLIQGLANRSAGLLLLTATPEQVGLTAHFARLHLLDPGRFHDLSSFLLEESSYGELNALCEAIESCDGEIPQELRMRVENGIGMPLDDASLETDDKVEIIKLLVDRHGTSRILYRNMRRNMVGFPGRRLHGYPLPITTDYPGSKNIGCASPEVNWDGDGWLNLDPRVEWLRNQLRSLSPSKVLVICAEAETAVALESYLHLRVGIRCAAFHEHLSIVERDRAAAYFADQEAGAQTLISSEIGSEGRNFQFCQHLVLFDLPRNPDLLEQRIGRLDRIGQIEEVQIHVPYVEATAQEVLFRWYQEGLNAFALTMASGSTIFERFSDSLANHMENPASDLVPFLTDTSRFAAELAESLHSGRDRLLERNSCDPAIGNKLKKSIQRMDEEPDLQQYFESVLDLYGVEHEFHSDSTMIVRPGSQSQHDDLPGIPEDGTTLCLHRATALQREDWQFLSWEHPLVRDCMELLSASELGSSNISLLPLRGVAAGTILLETVHVLRFPAPAGLQLHRFLGLNPMRTLHDRLGRNLSESISHEKLNTLCEPIDRSNVGTVIKQLSPVIKEVLPVALETARGIAKPVLAHARENACRTIGAEKDRLQYLQRISGGIRSAELAAITHQQQACAEHIQNATVDLDAIRLIVTRQP